MDTLYGIGLVVIVALFIVSRWINILNEYERAVTFWLGRLAREPKGPGLVFIFWPFEKMIKVSLRTVVLDVPPQDIITRDNVSVKVNAVVYFRVVEPARAIVEVENYLYATSQLAQTTLRSVLGQAEMDELLSEREKLNSQLQEIIDAQTDPWGIKVSMVELKHVDLPAEMQRAMARQAEAEREKRAKIIHAAGELEASVKLAEAAEIIAANPVTLQLRYLQTLTEIAAEKNSTILFPLPIELMRAFMSGFPGAGLGQAHGTGPGRGLAPGQSPGQTPGQTPGPSTTGPENRPPARTETLGS
jgi:regulator of protease activity HflC (stomatin/prohibitin superfamily)